MDFERAKAILIEAAQAAALEEYEIFYTDFDDVSTETLKNEISSFSSGKGRGIGFRCIINGRMGSASTEYFEENELKEIVSRAVANAEVIESDDPAIIFEGSEKYEEIEIKKFDLPSSAYIRELALKLQGETYAQSEFVTDGTQSGVFASKIRYALANSKGLSLSNEVGYAGAYVQAVVNKNDEAQEAFDFKLGLSDTEGLSAKATDEALSKLGAKGIASGKYKLIIDGKQMRSLLSTFSSVS